MWSQAAAHRVIVVAGCLGTAYTQLTMSPAVIEYARTLGATGVHIGLLGAVPTAMLVFQFVAAVLANHLRYRRRLWIACSVLQRVVFVPLAVAPWIFPDVPAELLLWGLLGLTAVNHALLHFCTPLWLSWMGDYIPKNMLNELWGVRHFYMQWVAAAALLGGAFALRESALGMQTGFAVMLIAGAAFGVADVLLFLRVEEPPVTALAEPQLAKVFSAPFRDENFRSFILFTMFWHFAAQVGAPFISFYLLSHIGVEVQYLLVLWMFSWIGGAVFSRQLGRWAQRFGNRPVLILCTAFKSINMIGLLLLPRDPTLAFWVMIPVFMVDAMLNAGIAIANNGFMIKNSPATNRTMFLAAGTAVAGMVGGLTSIVAGVCLTQMDGVNWTLGGLSISNFHVLFAVSLVLRLVAAGLAFRVREPESQGTLVTITQLIGATPLRYMRFPLGLYRSWRVDELTVPAEDKGLPVVLGEQQTLEDAPTRSRLEERGLTRED